MRYFITWFVYCVLVIVTGCGENIQESTPALTFGPPQDLKAISSGESTVMLSWSAAPGADDASFLGYIVQWGSTRDTVAKTELSYVADSLASGVTLFTISSYQSDGPPSNGATIRWAPAARFDAPMVVSEFTLQDPTRLSGFNVGSQSTDPSPIAMEPIDSAVVNLVDLYLFGGSGQLEAPLALWSAHFFRGDLKQTKFSTFVHSANSLDFPVSSFPDFASFIKDTVILTDNTIYYARISGDNLDTLYARIHVRIVPVLNFPNRTIEIRVSLQRVPGVLFAETIRGRGVNVWKKLSAKNVA